LKRPVLVVLAKAPVAGRSKTRLCPPLVPTEAAALAEAALRDTLRAVASVPGVRRVLALEGEAGSWLPPGLELVPQCDGGLADRLAAAFAGVGGPAVLVGMDTPQLTGAQLTHALDVLATPGVDAVLGPAADGGYWTIGLRGADDRVFDGVPMSSSRTCVAQRARLDALGMRVVELEELRDVDTIDDAWAVAAEAPRTGFAATLEVVGLRRAADRQQGVTDARARAGL
jgi:rSAM/selenodomain-associated transferase 1